jgi:prephenate dehydrogenase
MKVAIVGVGLMGGSIGLCIKKRGLADVVIGIGRSRERLLTAKERGAVDEITEDLRRVEDADLVFLATPILSIIEIGKKIAEWVDSSIVTDVGSTKREIVEALTPIIPRFVGTHPMAGSHKSGPESASPSLFDGSVTVITPVETTEISAKSKIEALWREMGTDVAELSPEEHDRLVAISSHIPHILSFCLVNLAEREKEIEPVLSTGFCDMARLSLSEPSMWKDIALSNRDNILRGLGEIKGIIDEWQGLIKKEDGLLERIADAKREAERLIGGRYG